MKKIAQTIICALFFSSSFAQNLSNPNFDSVYLGGIDRMYSWITSDAWVYHQNDTVIPMSPNTLYSFPGHSVNSLLYTCQLEYANPFDGQFAVKLVCNNQNYNVNGNLFPGFIANGTHLYTDNIGYLDIKRGGTPFTDRPVKLRGHFKFNNDSPSLSNFGKAIVLLKKYNSISNSIDTIGYAESGIQLFPTSVWTPFELPIVYRSNLAPDSVVVYFQASASDLNSTLWLDSLGFIYPSPSGIANIATQTDACFYDAVNEVIQITQPANTKEIKLYDLSGKLILKDEKQSQIAMGIYPDGIYFLHVQRNDGSKQIVKFSK